MILIKFVVLCFIVFLCASPSCELVVSEGLTGYSCLSVLLPLRVRLGHLSWNNSGGSATRPTTRKLHSRSRATANGNVDPHASEASARGEQGWYLGRARKSRLGRAEWKKEWGRAQEVQPTRHLPFPFLFLISFLFFLLSQFKLQF
jgi:hypothetical protein